MSLTTDIETYFDNAVAAVDGEYYKWEGKYDIDNIPRNMKSKSYHIEVGTLVSNPPNDHFLNDELEVTVRVIRKATKSQGNVRNATIDSAHLIRLEAQKPVRGLQNIRNVTLTDSTPEDLTDNDNSVVVIMRFNVQLIFNF